MSTENQDVVFPKVQETKMYLNADNEIVMVQSNWPEEDQVLTIPLAYVSAVIEKLNSLREEIEG